MSVSQTSLDALGLAGTREGIGPPSCRLADELRRRMAARIFAHVVEEMAQGEIAARQCTRLQMNGLHVHQIIQHHALLEFRHLFQE
jgi:hypothetical protein